MNYSLNEVEAIAKKAARGAGYTWGLAEEAAKSVRWLCSNGIDGCAALVRLLERVDGGEMTAFAPVIEAGAWSSKGGLICPLMAGAALADRARINEDDEIRIMGVAEPVIMLAFAAQCAAWNGNPMRIVCDRDTATVDGYQLDLSGPFAGPANVTLAHGGAIRTPNAKATRATPVVGVWEALNRFAHRTYAPATEESRIKGAGAGLVDTD